MADTWGDAAAKVRDGYKVWGKHYWKKTNRNDSTGGEYHVVRAKLLFANILTLGLVNIGFMVSVKRKQEQKRFWDEVLRAKVEHFAVMAHQGYGLDEGEFIRYFKYKVIGGDKPSVTPSRNTAFGRGWKQFIAAHRPQLVEAGLNWWE